jgi:hypothetical protein
MTKLVNAGNLAIWPVKTQQQVRDACPNAKFNLGHALACAWRFPGGETCWIVMVPDDQIKAAGLPVELVKRHEIAHCNGWPGDHRGARPFVDWAEVEDPPATAKPAKQYPLNKLLFGRPSVNWAKTPLAN